MKCTIIFGSPRKEGNTAALIKPFMEELRSHSVEIDYFDVYEKNIEGCRACLGCQKDQENISCIIMDDMQPILSSMQRADLIIYASPIYLWGAPGPVKTAMDRSVYASCKYYGDNPKGPALLKGKKLALINSCGFPVEKGTDLYEEMVRRYCKYTGLEYLGKLAERQRNLKEAFMDAEKESHAREFAKQLLESFNQ